MARHRCSHGPTNLTTTAEQIGLWKMRTVPLPKTDNPLMEWKRCEEALLCPFLTRLARRVLAVPATSASPERLFSTAGNYMTKKLRATLKGVWGGFAGSRVEGLGEEVVSLK